MCLYAGIGQRYINKNAITVTERRYVHAISLELTFASLHALKPAVINVYVSVTSAVLEPSTARSATTDSAGFLERAALWARHRMSDRRGDSWRAGD